MIQFKHIIFLVVLLLLSGLVSSCGRTSEASSAQGGEGEKGQWTQEEKDLLEKLRKQVKEAKWEGFASRVKIYQSNKQKIEEMIKGCTDALQTASELAKGKKVAGKDNGLQFLHDGLAIVKGINRTIANDIPILNQFFTDLLRLYQHFEKQASLNT